MIVQTGLLPIGVEVDGKVCRHFSVRPATLGDTIEAMEQADPDISAMRLSIAILARQLTIEGVEAPIDSAFLLGLFDLDYQAIEKANKELEKKLLHSSGDSNSAARPS